MSPCYVHTAVVSTQRRRLPSQVRFGTARATRHSECSHMHYPAVFQVIVHVLSKSSKTLWYIGVTIGEQMDLKLQFWHNKNPYFSGIGNFIMHLADIVFRLPPPRLRSTVDSLRLCPSQTPGWTSCDYVTFGR